jgi:hypothetical protein
LDPFGAGKHIPEQETLSLATRLYLAALRTDKMALQADLLFFMRPLVQSCILRGPTNMGEIASLIALALYEPLILFNTSEEMQLDGSGLLTAAASAARSLGMDQIPSRLHEIGIQKGQDSNKLLKMCSIWVTIAFISGINVMAGRFYLRPLVECRLEDIHQIETYCDHLHKIHSDSSSSSSSSSSPTGSSKELLSRVMVLILRYRTLRRFQDIIYDTFTKLNSLPLSPFLPAQDLLVESKARAMQLLKMKAQRVRAVRRRLREWERGPIVMYCVVKNHMLTFGCSFPH